jgi:hypothetical protein
MRGRWLAIVVAAGIVTLPSLARATSPLTATDVRFGDHGAYVRVVIDFSGTLTAREAEFRTLGKRMATASVNHPGVTTETTGGSGNGVTVALQPGNQALQIAMSYAPRKFKYLSYAVVTGNRLAIDLWKNAPPAAPMHTCNGLTLRSAHTTPGVVVARGTEHGIFENQFQVVVRSARGKIIGRRHVHGPGSWSATVGYSSSHRQTGTVEAVAFSAKDGAVECLAQKRVTLPAS